MNADQEITFGPGEFVLCADCGPYRAVFEQDDATAYLYIHSEGQVLYHLHIYNRTPEVVVAESDVQLVWTRTGDRCGVVIFGALRGVIGTNGDLYRPAQVMQGKGITEPKWTRGFTLA